MKFIGLSGKNSLVAQIKTFDNGEFDIDIANYLQWNRGRISTHNYCISRGYKMLSSYINNKEKILIDFKYGHKPHWITSGHLKKQSWMCPICSESKGEKAIRTYLENNNIKFIQEHRFNNCKYKNLLPFDFYILSKNLCIEFDGRQYFEENDFFG